MPGKFVRIAVSDCEHVEDAGLADFDLEDWQHERLEEQRQKIIKTNGSILGASLACITLLLMLSCLLLGLLYIDPLCKNHNNPDELSLQYFLLYDSAVLGLSFVLSIVFLLLSHHFWPQYSIKFVQVSGGLGLFGMFALQMLECIVYGKLFISTDSCCPLPVATVTIVMNLLFFGGPLLVFCCFAVGKTNTITTSEDMTTGLGVERDDDDDDDEEEEREEGDRDHHDDFNAL